MRGSVPVRPEEAEAVAPRLLRLLAGPGWRAADIRRLQPPRGFVLADPGRSRAVALVSLAADEAELLEIGVAPAARGQGIGAGLLADAMDRAARLGARRMILEVAEDNRPARALYARAGFAEAGRRAAYYPRPGGARADALVLARPLAAPAGPR